MSRTLGMIILLTVTMLAQSLYKETYDKPFFKGKYPQKIPLLFRTYPVYQDGGQYIVYIPVEVNYNFMQFLYEDGAYHAGAEFEAQFTHQESGKVFNKIWQTRLSVDNFAATNSKSRFHVALDSLQLPPGKYEVILKYHDLNGEQRLSLQQRLTLGTVERFYAAPPLFFGPDVPAAALLPEINGRPSPLQMHWDFNRPLGICLQIWRQDPDMAVPAFIELVDAEAGNTVFALDTVLANRAQRQWLQVNIPANVLKEGRHRLKAVYKFEGDSLRKIIPFANVWFEKPISLWDPGLALEPLQYIVDEAVYNEMSRGKAEEQLKKVQAFWEERDPTPGTPYNELENEFYTRVDSTIARFSNKRQIGWKTDPGKIYISLGPPDAVEDYSLAPIPNPYMRWIYQVDGKRLVYTFQALDGRKEYKLTHTEESAL